MAGGVVEVGRAAAGVTSIAVADCIDEEAAESREGRILVAEVERDGANLWPILDEGNSESGMSETKFWSLHADVRRGSPGCYGDDRDEYQKRTCGDRRMRRGCIGRLSFLRGVRCSRAEFRKRLAPLVPETEYGGILRGQVSSAEQARQGESVSCQSATCAT